MGEIAIILLTFPHTALGDFANSIGCLVVESELSCMDPHVLEDVDVLAYLKLGVHKGLVVLWALPWFVCILLVVKIITIGLFNAPNLWRHIDSLICTCGLVPALWILLQFESGASDKFYDRASCYGIRLLLFSLLPNECLPSYHHRLRHLFVFMLQEGLLVFGLILVIAHRGRVRVIVQGTSDACQCPSVVA